MIDSELTVVINGELTVINGELPQTSRAYFSYRKGEHNIFHPAVAFGVSCTNFASKRWSKCQFMSSPLARFHWIDVEVDVPKGFTKFAEWTTQQWFYSKITGHKCHDYGFATNIYLNFEKFIVRIFPGNYLLTANYTLLELQEG